MKERLPPRTRTPKRWRATQYEAARHGLALTVDAHPDGTWYGAARARWYLDTGETSLRGDWYNTPDRPHAHAVAFTCYRMNRTHAECALDCETVADKYEHWRSVLAFVRAAPAFLGCVR
jgi:hypothetical protein